MANDTYVPITICIYLSGCVLASAWPADFDLINVTLTNFGRNTAQPKRFWPDGGVGQVAGQARLGDFLSAADASDLDSI